MSWLGGQELLRSEVQEPDDVVAKIRAITTDQAVAAAKTYLNNASYRLAVVGPYDDDAMFQRLLA
jgi:predicted Zn-dependent peptidase